MRETTQTVVTITVSAKEIMKLQYSMIHVCQHSIIKIKIYMSILFSPNSRMILFILFAIKKLFLIRCKMMSFRISKMRLLI